MGFPPMKVPVSKAAGGLLKKGPPVRKPAPKKGAPAKPGMVAASFKGAGC